MRELYITIDTPVLKRLASLQVESPLVLQPSPIVLHTADLLAVVVRHRVLHRRTCRIDAELLDTVIKFFLLLYRPQISAPFIICIFL